MPDGLIFFSSANISMRGNMRISSNFLFRLGGATAMTGGLLRISSSFIPYQEKVVILETLYAFIDICLLFGLAAIYLKHAEKLESLGLIAFILATIGVASIVGPDATMFGVNFYEAGAALLITGLLLLSIQMLRKRTLIWASSFWILSFALTAAAAIFAHSLLFVGAGVSFGVAYVFAGIQLMKQLD
jgi:hypothetical protein